MRAIFIICVLFVMSAWSLPVNESVDVVETVEPENNNQEALLEVDSQGHENESGRQARQFGFGGFGIGFGGRFGGGGFGHGYGGYPYYGGYGGYGRYPYYGGYGGYGGYGRYGHHHHHYRNPYGFFG